jgi:hypothetical protein
LKSGLFFNASRPQVRKIPATYPGASAGNYRGDAEVPPVRPESRVIQRILQDGAAMFHALTAPLGDEVVGKIDGQTLAPVPSGHVDEDAVGHQLCSSSCQAPLRDVGYSYVIL